MLGSKEPEFRMRNLNTVVDQQRAAISGDTATGGTIAVGCRSGLPRPKSLLRRLPDTAHPRNNGGTVTQAESRPWRLASTVVVLAAFVNPAIARADEPRFGAHDIPTAFYISKSDDHNRVDYGMRLGAHCTASNNDAVFPYWREFEHAPPVRTHSLGALEYFAYGVSGQGVHGNSESSGEYWVRLKQFGQRPIWISTKREADGHCSALARCTIAGVKFAQLISIYVKLSGPLSVDYVVVKGKNLDTGQLLEERLKK
jgi:hypothetical protein